MAEQGSDDAADEADRAARRGEWFEAKVHCAQAIANVERLRLTEPDEIVHVATLADLWYFQAEILTQTGDLAQAADAARRSMRLYQVLRSLNPINTSDRVRDAKSRWLLLELMCRDDEVPYGERIPAARARTEREPGPDADHELARQLARQGLDRTEVPLLIEASTVYGRLRPLGEDDLVLFAEAALRAAAALHDTGRFNEAAQLAADAAQAYGLLSSRRPDRYDKHWYDARDLANRSERAASGT